jgi:hypothetical protein
MPPKFKNNLAYQQAELLMQPAFIRVIDNIRKESEISNWESSYEEISEPFPGYVLFLKKEKTTIKINLWDLCFQVCFVDYNPQKNEIVEIDPNLFNNTGQLDWQNLETKTKKIVKNIFNYG